MLGLNGGVSCFSYALYLTDKSDIEIMAFEPIDNMISDEDTRIRVEASENDSLRAGEEDKKTFLAKFNALFWKILLRLGGLAVVGYVFLCLALYFLQTSMLFPIANGVFLADPAAGLPPKSSPYTEATVRFTTMTDENGIVYAYFVPAKTANKYNPRPVAIFLHGNAELACQQDQIVSQYHRMGISVLFPEFRGYGTAKGVPSEEKIVEDCLAFYEQLVKRDDVDRKHIIVHGRSIGGALAVQLASKLKRRPAALILQSTPASVKTLAWEKFKVPSFIIENPLESDKAIAILDKTPVLIFHGMQDEIVPYKDAIYLDGIAVDSKLVSYETDHNEMPPIRKLIEHWETIHTFLNVNKVLLHR